MGVGLGVLSQLLYYQFERWRKRKAIEIHYPELMEERPGSVVSWSLWVCGKLVHNASFLY